MVKTFQKKSFLNKHIAFILCPLRSGQKKMDQPAGWSIISWRKLNLSYFVAGRESTGFEVVAAAGKLS